MQFLLVRERETSAHKGSFKKDLLRALHQLYIWKSADKAIIPEDEPQKYGWHLGDDGSYSAETTDTNIAPKAIIRLISCKCGGNCNDRPCGCVKNDVVLVDVVTPVKMLVLPRMII